MSIKINVPTAELKRILDDNPEVLLEIQKTAAEKIAEELNRKLNRDLTENIEKELASLHQSKFKALQYNYQFPDEAKKLISNFVERYMKQELTGAITELRRENDRQVADKIEKIDATISRIMEAAVAEAKEAIKDDVAKQAREEFLSVLAEVKAHTPL